MGAQRPAFSRLLPISLRLRLTFWYGALDCRPTTAGNDWFSSTTTMTCRIGTTGLPGLAHRLRTGAAAAGSASCASPRQETATTAAISPRLDFSRLEVLGVLTRSLIRPVRRHSTPERGAYRAR